MPVSPAAAALMQAARSYTSHSSARQPANHSETGRSNTRRVRTRCRTGPSGPLPRSSAPAILPSEGARALHETRACPGPIWHRQSRPVAGRSGIAHRDKRGHRTRCPVPARRGKAKVRPRRYLIDVPVLLAHPGCCCNKLIKINRFSYVRLESCRERTIHIAGAGKAAQCDRGRTRRGLQCTKGSE